MSLCHRYEIGEGLYIGWASATLAICGGSCLLCACKVQTPNEKMWVFVAEISGIHSLDKMVEEVVHVLPTETWILCFRPYPYQPTSRGHVLSTVESSQTVPSNYGRNAYVWEVIVEEGERAGLESVHQIDEQCLLLSDMMIKYIFDPQITLSCYTIVLKFLKFVISSVVIICYTHVSSNLPQVFWLRKMRVAPLPQNVLWLCYKHKSSYVGVSNICWDTSEIRSKKGWSKNLHRLISEPEHSSNRVEINVAFVGFVHLNLFWHIGL